MLSFALAFIVWPWLQRLGGPGLILLGVADSFMVIPGSMDALTLVLSADQRTWWPYYASMATLGSLAGAYVSYSLGRKGGKEGLEKRISHRRAEKIFNEFKRHGFWSILIPALLPPPMPCTPFLLAAGALRYPRRRFFAIVGVARGFRYSLVAFLGSSYSQQIFGFVGDNREPILWTIVALAVVGGLTGAIYISRRRRERFMPPSV